MVTVPGHGALDDLPVDPCRPQMVVLGPLLKIEEIGKEAERFALPATGDQWQTQGVIPGWSQFSADSIASARYRWLFRWAFSEAGSFSRFER